ncbi:MAG TPA: septal ring lytic transglycosylase RlpA family protein [Janthinobacterium sp.]|nr:septal ring lytic transglycosylase RlpA family protein [Janthinobacterium sp.]
MRAVCAALASASAPARRGPARLARAGNGAALPVWLILLMLAGCGTVSKQVRAPSASPPAPPSSAAARPEPGVPVLPPAGSGRGGYYKDDGPGDNPPPGLLNVPDAEPRVEPYLPRANRPYVVFGTTYTPLTGDTPFVQRGVGSWYGKKFQGQRTSSGELYDMYKMTAAHPTLPIPSYARVTNLATGKQVIVRINDRGPFHTNRVIDVSYTAALQLGFLAKGSHEVQVERLLPADIERINAAKLAPPAPQPEAPPPALFALSAAPAPAAPEIAALMLGDQAPALTTEAPQMAAAPVLLPVAAPPPEEMVPLAAQAQASARAVPEAAKGGFYLQLGAFARSENAEAVRTRLAPYAGEVGVLEVVDAGPVHRLYSGPFQTRQEASQALAALPAGMNLKPIIVQR